MQVALADFARSLQSEAGRITTRRQSDSKLYTVLGGCMQLCERCGDPAEEAEMRRLVVALGPLPGKKRHYVERGSDVYQLVARFVFHGEAHSANTNRYAHTLRQAATLQIRGAALAQWLAENGGVNALYMRRPLDRDDVSTKCLRLTESIVVPKGTPFTLVLRRTPENAFEVVEQR